MAKLKFKAEYTLVSKGKRYASRTLPKPVYLDNDPYQNVDMTPDPDGKTTGDVNDR